MNKFCSPFPVYDIQPSENSLLFVAKFYSFKGWHQILLSCVWGFQNFVDQGPRCEEPQSLISRARVLKVQESESMATEIKESVLSRKE